MTRHWPTTSSAPAIRCRSTFAKGRAGKDRLYHWRVAAGSADEIIGALLVGEALEYVTRADIAPSLGFADRVLAMTWRMTHA